MTLLAFLLDLQPTEEVRFRADHREGGRPLLRVEVEDNDGAQIVGRSYLVDPLELAALAARGKSEEVLVGRLGAVRDEVRAHVREEGRGKDQARMAFRPLWMDCGCGKMITIHGVVPEAASEVHCTCGRVYPLPTLGARVLPTGNWRGPE